MTRIERIKRAVKHYAMQRKGEKDDFSRGWKSVCRQIYEYLENEDSEEVLPNIQAARLGIQDTILALNNERDECRESNWIKYGKLCIVIEMLQTIQRKFYVFDLDDEDD